MRPAPEKEYRALTIMVPEEAELVQWLAAIGRPPRFDKNPVHRRKTWVEEQMFELGIIDKIDEQHYHDWAIDYLDWLKSCKEKEQEDGKAD